MGREMQQATAISSSRRPYCLCMALFVGTAVLFVASCAGLPEPTVECQLSISCAEELRYRGEFFAALQAYNAALAGAHAGSGQEVASPDTVERLLSQGSGAFVVIEYTDELPYVCLPVLADTYAGVGAVLRELQDYAAAAEAFGFAESFSEGFDELETQRRLWHLSAIELKLNDGADVQGLRDQLFALAPLPGHDGPELESALLAAWGALMRRQVEPELAAAMFAKAAERAAHAGRFGEAARLRREEASSYVVLRSDEAAVIGYTQAIEYAQRAGNPAIEAEAQRELARSLARLEDYDGAERAWLRALELHSGLSYAPSDRLADVKFDLAVLYELDASRGNAYAQYYKALREYELYFERSAAARVRESTRRHAEIIRRYEAVRFRLGISAAP